MARTTLSTGTVSAFDDDRGLGEVTGDDGTVLAFHCTAIADGTRSIAVGTAVRYQVRAGRLGRWEADGLDAEAKGPTAGPRAP